MKKKYVVLVGTMLASIVLLTGCFEAGERTRKADVDAGMIEPEPVGFWNNTTSYRWMTNGTCCGEKEQLLQVYNLDGINTNESRWVDTNQTRNNLSMLPDDGWYPSGFGDLYSREEYYREYYALGGACLYTLAGARWKSTGVIIMWDVSSTKDISIERGSDTVWYFVVEPVGNETVDIVFKILGKGGDLPVFSSHDMRTIYHSGPVVLPEKYTLSLHMQSGSVNIYILDEIGYNDVFK